MDFLVTALAKANVLKCIVCGLAIGTAGSAFASSLLILCICRTITGFFATGIIGVSLALIGDTVPKSQRQIHGDCFFMSRFKCRVGWLNHQIY
ncbi:MAG: hypothetical protein PHX70_08675 [Clostridium sp.]|nr:hypothetical protein [Clostridium sp.]